MPVLGFLLESLEEGLRLHALVQQKMSELVGAQMCFCQIVEVTLAEQSLKNKLKKIIFRRKPPIQK